MRLAIVASHPVQYYAPLYRELARHLDMTVFYAHRDTAADQARAGFGQGFAWDVDLTSGYRHQFLTNVAPQPALGNFAGVDTPGIGAALRNGSFDAVLIMGWYLKAFIQALWAARRAGIRVLVRGDSHLATPRSWAKRIGKELFYPMFLRQFDAALVVGHRNRNYWEHYRYPAHRMFQSPHCVDTAWFASLATVTARAEIRSRIGVVPDTPIALFAGKLVGFKRPVDLLFAAARVRAGGIPLEVLVAGSGPLEADLRMQAKALDVPVHFLGFCNQTAMPGVYAAADVLVLPSDGRETWGLVVNEAMASGSMVIVSNAAGCAPDIADHLGECSVFPVGDIETLASRLSQSFRYPTSANVISAAVSAFSINSAARGILQAIRTTTS